MRAPVLVLVLLLAACLPEQQPHHQPLEESLVTAVRAALVATIGAIPDTPMPSEASLDHESRLLAHFARNAEPAYAALADGSLDDDRLRRFGATMVARMRERQGAEMEPPLILDALLATQHALEPAERVLLLGAINRLASQAQLPLSETERRFLGRETPQSDDPRSAQ